jgi:hypothetical protein
MSAIERDLLAKFQIESKKIKQLEQERDESVAHCGVLNSALIQALAFMARETCGIEDEQQQKRIQDAVRNYGTALKQTPQQSLLFHDAGVIENLVDGSPDGVVTLKSGKTIGLGNWLFFKANQLRQQAKELL